MRTIMKFSYCPSWRTYRLLKGVKALRKMWREKILSAGKNYINRRKK